MDEIPLAIGEGIYFFKQMLEELLHEIGQVINNFFYGMEPWKIAILTAIFVLLLFQIKIWIAEIIDNGMYPIWRFFRRLPFIKQSIAKQMSSTVAVVEEELQKGLEKKTFLKCIPCQGWNENNIIKEIENYTSYGKYDWSKGYVSGAVYHGNDKALASLMKGVYGMTAYTNPLHPDIFPGIRIMEAEIIQMVSFLFHAPDSIGTVTSGGTESIFLVCKAYRDYAFYKKGIKNPNMVIPVTAHAAFDKAALMLKIRVKHVKMDPKTTKVDIKAMKKAINSNTCMLVGSTPAFPHGAIDPIQNIAELGRKYNIPVHVDACLGGFLLPFMSQAGYPPPPFDFLVPGVTSISVDTHKYAYAPKGSSIILYRNKTFRHYQFSVQPDWPGGIYATPSLSGSRSGGVIATCWASLLYHGIDTYIDCTRKIISTTKYIEKKLQEIKDIHIIGKPDVSVIAIGSETFDIYRLSSLLSKRGWNLNALQFPPGFHLCVTLQHTYEGVADKFVMDVKECVDEIIQMPNEKTTGTAAIYGMSQGIPDRSLVAELAWAYLDACSSTGKSLKETNSELSKKEA